MSAALWSVVEISGHFCHKLVGQADLLTPIKAHADLPAWHADINFDKTLKSKHLYKVIPI
jgi:hypothetical protein